MEQLRYSLQTDSFRGINALFGDMTVDPKYAVEAYNIEFSGDSVQIPRCGMGRFYDLLASAGCRSSEFWRSDFGSFVVFFGISAGTGALYAIKDLYTASPSVVTISIGINATHARFASWGNQLLIAFLNDQQEGSDAGRILTFDGTNFNLSVAFPYPMTTVPTLTASVASGFTTVGKHWIGYVPEYTDGHLGKMSPDVTLSGSLPSASTFEPSDITIPSASIEGGGTITVDFTSVTWPSNVRAIHLVMTPITNDFDYYFVPGGRHLVPSGTTSTLSVTINTSDTELYVQEQANSHIYHYVSGPSAGTNPFLPSNVAVYGRRACWVTNIPTVTDSISAILVSEIDNPQAVRLDTGLVKMPDGSNIKAIIGLDNSLLIGGTSGLALVQDTQADPATWPVRYIDESRGVLSVNAFYPDKSAPNGQNEAASSKCWVLTESGLVHTSGTSIPARTLCEQFKDGKKTGWWDRINWKNGNRIQIVDCPDKFTLYVLVPLDKATEPTHILCFHYFLGKSETQVNLHIMQIQGYRVGTLVIVHNANPFVLQNGTYRDELFVFSFDPNKVILRMKGRGDYDPIRNRDVEVYTDDANNPYTEMINATYVTSARPKLPNSINACGPFLVHVQGKGKLQPFGITYPRGKQFDYKAIDMTVGNSAISHERGVTHKRTKVLKTTGVRIGYRMVDAGDWCIIEFMTTWHEPVTEIAGSYGG